MRSTILGWHLCPPPGAGNLFSYDSTRGLLRLLVEIGAEADVRAGDRATLARAACEVASVEKRRGKLVVSLRGDSLLAVSIHGDPGTLEPLAIESAGPWKPSPVSRFRVAGAAYLRSGWATIVWLGATVTTNMVNNNSLSYDLAPHAFPGGADLEIHRAQEAA